MKRGEILADVAIETAVAEGKGLARIEGKVLFVKNGLPGDIANVKITNVKKDFAEGEIESVISPSSYRQAPFCAHFGLCGGCKWQQATYEGQLHFKQNIVKEAFDRIGKFEYPGLEPILGAPSATYYRNKMEYTFSAKGWLTWDQINSGDEFERRVLGFHVPGGFASVINIDKCYLQDQRADDIRNGLHKLAMERDFSFYNLRDKKGFLRNLIIRNTSINEWMVVLVVAENDAVNINACMEFLDNGFPFITSLNYVINPKINDTIYDLKVINYKGKDHIIENLNGVNYKISTKSFFQTNSEQARFLYSKAMEMAEISGNETVYDLYTGTGSIALYFATKCKKVVGIEQIAEAIEDAKENAILNNLDNADFYVGNVEDMFTTDFIAKNGAPDILVTDPPRAGMHPRVIEVLRVAQPPRIVYISCNPVTQARDIALLSDIYAVKKVLPVDMFPQTFHVENIAVLELKNTL